MRVAVIVAALSASLCLSFASLGSSQTIGPIGPAPIPNAPGIGAILGLGGGAGGIGGLGVNPAQVISPATVTVPAIKSVAQTQTLPPNYTLYGVTIRSIQGTAQGLSITCDSSEIAVGSLCREVAALPSEGNNALLTSGVMTYRSTACYWKNSGLYHASASCLAFRPLQGDWAANHYAPNFALP